MSNEPLDVRLLVMDDDPQILRACRLILKQHFLHIDATEQPGKLEQLLR
jgi:hypothetical protein